jgi:hypothetical protein
MLTRSGSALVFANVDQLRGHSNGRKLGISLSTSLRIRIKNLSRACFLRIVYDINKRLHVDLSKE